MNRSHPRQALWNFVGAMLAATTSVTVAGCVGSTADPLSTVEEELVVCAKAETVEGIDISKYQGDIDWKAVKASGKVFAIARISDGSYLDTYFDANWPAMKAVGLIRGSYQFFRPGQDAVAQADIVIKKVGKLGDGDLPVTIDVEATDSQTPAVIAAKIKTWVDRVEKGTGKKPIVYTGKYFWNDNVKTADYASYPLWIAAYSPKCPDLPTVWADWMFFQYTSSGKVSGIVGNVDLDKFNGTEAELRKYTTSTPPLPDLAAVITGQTHPVTLKVGDRAEARVTLKNTGSATWDSRVKLATTTPRDRESGFVGLDWAAPNRPAAVVGNVAPGATIEFRFTLQAPLKPGKYTEAFSVVQDGVAWFADRGGPKEDALVWTIDVTEGSVSDAGADSGTDVGVDSSADTGAADAADEDSSRPDTGLADGENLPIANVSSSGSCAAGSSPSTRNDTSLVLGAALAGLAFARRRRSTTPS